MTMEDDLRPEYDLKNLRVRKLGSGRKDLAERIVKLESKESNFAEMLPSADGSSGSVVGTVSSDAISLF